MLFTDLNTKVLLDIFGCLDLIDVINLAGTCTKIRDTAQLHYTVRYKVFNLNNFLADREQVQRHNYVDATLVLKAIGHVISVLVTDLDETQIGSDLGAVIRKYCVNVKSLKIVAQRFPRADWSWPCVCYSEWLKNLKLEKITLGVGDIPILDLCETSTLNELVVIHVVSSLSYYSDNTTAPQVMKRLFERNHNITRLSIPLFDHLDYEIFVKLTSLKCISFSRITKGDLSKVAAKLKMSDLERVEITDNIDKDFDEVNAFLRTLAENSPRLNNLSIGRFVPYHPVNKNPLYSLHLFELTSLRLCVTYPDFYKEIPKMQPNLKHLDLQTYRDVDPALQIISLIQNLKKLEIMHIDIGENSMSPVLKELKDEVDSHRILNAHSINRPALRIYINDFVQVKLNFKECKFTTIHIPQSRNYFSESIYAWVLPCCY